MDKQTKSARQIKEEKVERLAKKIKKAKSITFTNYHGLSAEQLGALRASIKESGGEFLVEKNSLMKLALQISNFPFDSKLAQGEQFPISNFTGPTAVVFAYDDEIAPIRDIAKSSKSLGFPTFKFGFFGKDFIDESGLGRLSIIPGRQTLQANLVGSLTSPISGLVFVLSANMRNLVSVLEQTVKLATSH